MTPIHVKWHRAYHNSLRLATIAIAFFHHSSQIILKRLDKSSSDRSPQSIPLDKPSHVSHLKKVHPPAVHQVEVAPVCFRPLPT